MILIRCNLQDKYVLLGAKHFFEKFGIPVQISGNLMVYMPYTDKTNEISEKNCEFTVEIIEKNNGFTLEILKSSGSVKKTYDEVYRPLITYSRDKVTVRFDIFREIGYMVSGKIEEMMSAGEKIADDIPIVDYHEKMFFEILLYACEKTALPLIQKEFWPDGKSFAVCLTHDVDEMRKTYQYFTQFIKHIWKKNFSRAWYHIKSFFINLLSGKNPYWTFEDIMKLEDGLNVRSTFFFLNESAKVDIFKPKTWTHYARKYEFSDRKVAEIINKLFSEGWEIGLHGSYESYKDKWKLKKEKEYLESVLGHKIYGIRQHRLNLEIPRTWQYQEETGFEYDTSLGFRSSAGMGFRWGTCFPFYPYNAEQGRRMSLLEIPLTLMDVSLEEEDIWKNCTNFIDVVEKCGGVLTLLWHHNRFNGKEYPGYPDIYRRIIEICKKKNAWVVTAHEIAKWWNTRDGCNISVDRTDESIIIRPSRRSFVKHIKIHIPNEFYKKINLLNVKIIGTEGNFVIFRGVECPIMLNNDVGM
ncbi:MAG: hypothetical protein H0Z28_09665 [Archaeoglobus sp.]|nr:hypothetical protein [Archaeoglobus sp.]